MTKIVSYVCIALCSIFISHSAFCNDLVTVGRYSTIDIQPTQAEINSLSAVAQFNFPSKIRTIKQAIELVLANTGYRLAQHFTPAVFKTLSLPLPVTNRQLSPMQVSTTLCVLMGYDVYDLKVNPVSRTVNFVLKKQYQPHQTVTPVTLAKTKSVKHHPRSHNAKD